MAALVLTLGLGQVVLGDCLMVCHRSDGRALSAPAAPGAGGARRPHRASRACTHTHQASRALLPAGSPVANPLAPLGTPANAAMRDAPGAGGTAHAWHAPDTSPDLPSALARPIALRL